MLAGRLFAFSGMMEMGKGPAAGEEQRTMLFPEKKSASASRTSGVAALLATARATCAVPRLYSTLAVDSRDDFEIIYFETRLVIR